MTKEEIKPGDLVLWKGPTWPHDPLLRKVTEVRDECLYFDKGLPNGLATCPFEHVSEYERLIEKQ